MQHQVRARCDPHGPGQLRLLLDDHRDVFLLDVFTWSQLVVAADHDHGLVDRCTTVDFMSARWRGDGKARRVGLAVGVGQVARLG